jgi:hypothetical protein
MSDNFSYRAETISFAIQAATAALLERKAPEEEWEAVGNLFGELTSLVKDQILSPEIRLKKGLPLLLQSLQDCNQKIKSASVPMTEQDYCDEYEIITNALEAWGLKDNLMAKDMSLSFLVDSFVAVAAKSEGEDLCCSLVHDIREMPQGALCRLYLMP